MRWCGGAIAPTPRGTLPEPFPGAQAQGGRPVHRGPTASAARGQGMAVAYTRLARAGNNQNREKMATLARHAAPATTQPTTRTPYFLTGTPPVRARTIWPSRMVAYPFLACSIATSGEQGAVAHRIDDGGPGAARPEAEAGPYLASLRSQRSISRWRAAIGRPQQLYGGR